MCVLINGLIKFSNLKHFMFVLAVSFIMSLGTWVFPAYII